MAQDWGILRNVNFIKLWGSQITSQLAASVLTFGFVLALYQQTKSAALVAVLVGLLNVPPILFASLAGTVADSYSRRHILVIANAGRAGCVALAFFGAHYPWAIISAALLMQSLTQFFGPAETSSIPLIVKKEQLFTANSFFSITLYATFLLGYAAAGPVLEGIGDRMTYIVAFVLYSIATLLDILLPSLTQHLGLLQRMGIRVRHELRMVWQRFLEGFQYVAKNPLTLFILIQVSTVFAIQKAFISLLPSFALDYLGFTVKSISVILILPVACGTLAGVALANYLKHRVPKQRMISTGMVVDGAALLLAAILYPLAYGAHAIIPGVSVDVLRIAIVILLASAIGFADPFIIISVQTTLQERTPLGEQGRVFGFQSMLQNLLALGVVLMVGVANKFLSVPSVLAILGGITALFAIIGMRFFRHRTLGVE